MNERVSNACRLTIGLFLGSAAGLLVYEGAFFIPLVNNHQNLLEIVLAAFTFASCGIVLGIALAIGRKEQLSLTQAARGFGLGFLISGAVYYLSDAMLKDEYQYVFNRAVRGAHLLFILALAAALSAVFTRSRLFSVINSVVSVAVGWTIIMILSSVFNEIFSDYLFTALLLYGTLFGAITGALLTTQTKGAEDYQGLFQPRCKL